MYSYSLHTQYILDSCVYVPDGVKSEKLNCMVRLDCGDMAQKLSSCTVFAVSLILYGPTTNPPDLVGVVS